MTDARTFMDVLHANGPAAERAVNPDILDRPPLEDPPEVDLAVARVARRRARA